MQNILRDYYSVMYSAPNCMCCHLFFLVVELKEKMVDVIGKVANWICVMGFLAAVYLSQGIPNVLSNSQIAS